MNFRKAKKQLALLSSLQSFGVDFNNDILKVLQIKKKKDRHEIAGWNSIRIPSGTMDNFEIKNKEVFIKTLLDAIKNAKGKIKGRAVVVCIPENKVFTRIITLPKMNENEVKEAIHWEIESNIPISVDETYYDWQIVDNDSKKTKILAVATPRKIIDNYLEVFDAADLIVSAFEPVSIATGRSIIDIEDKSSILILDIGLDGTGYAIFNGGYPVFTSCGSVTGKLFTDAVASYFGVDWKKAESYKIKVGLGSNKKEREEALSIYGSLLSLLLEEIEKTIAFFESQLAKNNGGGKDGDQERTVSKIILCGGGSNLRGLASFLALNLKKTVIQADPWKNVNFGNRLPQISKEEAQGYITAIGLALRDYWRENGKNKSSS